MDFNVNFNRIDIANKEFMTSGAVNIFEAHFEFDESWNGYARTAVFRSGDYGAAVAVVLDATDTCTVPWESLIAEAPLWVGVVGVSGDKKLPTNYVNAGCVAEGAEGGDFAPPPTPSEIEQILAQIGDLRNLKTKAKDTLVAAINELAAKPAGYKPYPVALTQSGNKWTAGHTLAEVKEALAQGYSPYCVYNSWPIPCTGVEDNFVYYTGWLGTQTTAVWIMQSKSGVTVIARNTFGTDYLTYLVDDDGSFGGLNALIATNPRTAVVYNLGGTPEGQDLSAMTFPALLWGTATDATARTQTFGLTGAGGDQWRVVRKVDTGEVTFEQVEMGTKIYTLTPDQETEAASVNCTWAELAAAVKSGATVMLDAGALEPGASHIILTARNWYFDDDGNGEVYFQSAPGVMPRKVLSATCSPGENDTVGVDIKVSQELTENTVFNIASDAANDVMSDLQEQIASIDKWELIQSVKTTEDVTNVVVNKDSNGNPFSLTKLAVFAGFNRPGDPGSGTVTTNIPIYLGMNGVVFTSPGSAWLIGYSPTNTEGMLTDTHSVVVFEAVGGKMLPTHIRASLSDKDVETSTMVTNPTPLGKDLGIYDYYAMERYSVAPCRSIELRNISETKISIFKGSTIEVWGVRSR